MTEAEREAIVMRADIRRRQQELEVNVRNIDMPGNTDAMKTTYQKTLERVRAEAKGEQKVGAPQVGSEDVGTLRVKARGRG